MKLKEIVSCYPTKIYQCDRSAYDALVARFESGSLGIENKWTKRVKSDAKVVFKKGAAVALTFDYSSSKLEVQVIFEYDEDKGHLSLSVGNWGFPFEPLLSKNRYLKLLEEMHGAIINTGEAVEITA